MPEEAKKYLELGCLSFPLTKGRRGYPHGKTIRIGYGRRMKLETDRINGQKKYF